MPYARGVWRNQKGVIRSRKSKKGNQLTGQKGQNIIYIALQGKLKTAKHEAHWKLKSAAPDWWTVSDSLETLTVLLNDEREG